jgi:membrane-associated phospholipid phosphatase
MSDPRTEAHRVAETTLTRGGRLLRGLVAMVVFVVPVALLAFAVRERFGPLIRMDEAVTRWATDITRAGGLGPALIALQEATRPVILYIPATAVVVWAWLARGLRPRSLWAFVTMMVAWNLGLLVKLLVQRARPVVDDPISHAPGFSFPSGHAFNVAVIATALVFLLWPLLSTRSRRVAVAVAAVVVVVVALNRVFLGVHFLSDVCAGVLLGVGITFSSWIGFIGRTAAPSSLGPSHPA